MFPEPNPPPTPPPAVPGGPPTGNDPSAPRLIDPQIEDDFIEAFSTDREIRIDYQFRDPDGDLARVRIAYVDIARDLVADVISLGVTEGELTVFFTVPPGDSPGRYAFDIFLEDEAGLTSNSFRLSYTIQEPPIPGSRANVDGVWRVVFTSEFGDRMVDRYDVAQAGSRISWAASCDDVRNVINCFFMDDATGTIQSSTDRGRTFRFSMADGVCTRISGTITVEDGRAVRITGSKRDNGSSFCTSSRAFPEGTFTAQRN